jgi:hypothetical protein
MGGNKPAGRAEPQLFRAPLNDLGAWQIKPGFFMPKIYFKKVLVE